jgi:hypothetical protein
MSVWVAEPSELRVSLYLGLELTDPSELVV